MKQLLDLWKAFPQAKFHYHILFGIAFGIPFPVSVSVRYDGDIIFFATLAMLACLPVLVLTGLIT